MLRCRQHCGALTLRCSVRPGSALLNCRLLALVLTILHAGVLTYAANCLGRLDAAAMKASDLGCMCHSIVLLNSSCAYTSACKFCWPQHSSERVLCDAHPMCWRWHRTLLVINLQQHDDLQSALEPTSL